MKKKGFTIIELVLVLVVMGIASAGLATVIAQSLINTHRTEVISIATALCLNEAERVTRLSFASVASQNCGSPQAYAGNLSNYRWEVCVDSIDNKQPNLGSDTAMSNYKVVDVNIYHSAIGSTTVRFLKTNH